MVGNIRRVNSNASEQSYALLAWVVVLFRYTDIVTENRIGWPWLPEMFRRQADMSLARCCRTCRRTARSEPSATPRAIDKLDRLQTSSRCFRDEVKQQPGSEVVVQNLPSPGVG